MRSTHGSGPARGRERWKFVARICERALFVVAAVCLLVYAAACAHGSFFGARDRTAFEQALNASIQQEDHDQSDWSEARLRHYEQVAGAPVRRWW